MYLILSGKSTRMRPILWKYWSVIVSKWPLKSWNCNFLDFCHVYRMNSLIWIIITILTVLFRMIQENIALARKILRSSGQSIIYEYKWGKRRLRTNSHSLSNENNYFHLNYHQLSLWYIYILNVDVFSGAEIVIW